MSYNFHILCKNWKLHNTKKNKKPYVKFNFQKKNNGITHTCTIVQ